MRAARLISLVLLLQNRGRLSGAELAAELSVSRRTVARDVLELAEAGIPVYAERGRAGGYRLLDGFRTRLTGLDRAEVEALFLSGAPDALRGLGMDGAALAASLKVGAAISPSAREAPVRVKQRFYLDAPGWFRRTEHPPQLEALSRAVWGDLLVEAKYLRGRRLREGTAPAPVSRVLAPYGLVLKAGVWYLAAGVNGPKGQFAKSCPQAPGYPQAEPKQLAGQAEGGIGSTPWGGGVAAPEHGGASSSRGAEAPREASFRVYRVDRFDDVLLSETSFERDPDFDLAEFWAANAEEFDRSLLRETAVLRLSPAGLKGLPRAVSRPAAEAALASASEPDARGWVTVTLPVESVDIAYAEVLGLGPEAEVVSPPVLRSRLAEAAARLAETYREPAPRGEVTAP
ncbi:MAG: helix-turn-helix transcriptional regulator [Stackebrandtia sp.]